MQQQIQELYQDYYRVEYLKDMAHNPDVKRSLIKLSTILISAIYSLERKP